jgi:hypothetical protein
MMITKHILSIGMAGNVERMCCAALHILSTYKYS